ncbi:hypothetical protein FHT92_004933 [Rhizobium sp. BK377]|nr:hypothetical protein [Rhizobium sp. BK377]
MFFSIHSRTISLTVSLRVLPNSPAKSLESFFNVIVEGDRAQQQCGAAEQDLQISRRNVRDPIGGVFEKGGYVGHRQGSLPHGHQG